MYEGFSTATLDIQHVTPTVFAAFVSDLVFFAEPGRNQNSPCDLCSKNNVSQSTEMELTILPKSIDFWPSATLLLKLEATHYMQL